jgi:plastocyanin
MAWHCAAASAADQAISFPTGTAGAPYMPADVSIGPGETVTFTGAFANHPLVWDGGDFATQSTGTSMAYVLTQPGVHRFHCQIHPTTMVGSVQVSGDALATPDFTWAPSAPRTGQAVTFSATAFTDPDGSIQTYQWDLDGDGSFESTGPSPSHTYAAAGSYAVGLRYVDDRNETSSATTHTLTVVSGAGDGSGGGATPSSGRPGGTGSGAPNQPGASSGPSSPGNGTQGAGTAAPTVRIATRALAFRGGQARLALKVSRTTALEATLRRGRTTLATGAATARRAGATTIVLKLTRAGTGALRRAHGRMRASLAVVARPRKGGTATTVKRTLSVSAR